MKKLAIALVLVVSAATGWSQCKTDRVSLHDETSKSHSVIIGTVMAAQPVPEAWDFLDGVNYTVRIDSKMRGKGHVSEEVTIFSENSPKFFPMYVGQQYVLYLEPQYGRYQVDNCGNSHAVDEVLSAKQPKLTAARGF
jgi:hypothetical protein